MSSFKAELIIEGKIYPLRHCGFDYVQDVRSDGMPGTKVRGGNIMLVLQDPAPKEIVQWIINPMDKKTGSVRFYEVNALTGTHQVLDFTDAFCIRFENKFDGEVHGTGTLLSSFTLNAQLVSFDSVGFNQ